MRTEIKLNSKILETALIIFNERAKEAVIDGVHIEKVDGEIHLWIEE